MPAAEANQHDEQGADHEEVAGKAEAGLAGDEAKEPDQGKENEDPVANPARLSFGKNPQNLASKAGKRCRKLGG